MLNKYIIGAAILAAALILTVVNVHESHNLTFDSNFSVKYESISSILRTDFTAISYVNDTVFAGDSVGSVTIFAYDEKKKTLSFEDVSRSSSGVLPPPNRVLKTSGNNVGVAVLTADGQINTFALNSAKKITGTIKWELPDSLNNFVLIESGNKVYVSGTSTTLKQLCLYQLSESIVKPNPITKLACNQTVGNVTYEDISYDSKNGLIAVGNKKSAYFFRANVTDKNPLVYLCNAFMPAADENGYKNQFTNNGTLIAINDLWVASIIVDPSIPSSKVISAQKTQKLTKSGGTSAVSVSKQLSTREKEALVLINAKGKIKTYKIGNNSKLAYVNDSRTIGKPASFALKNNEIVFVLNNNEVFSAEIGTDETDDYIKVDSSFDISSKNHYQPVSVIGQWNDVVATASAGGKNNFKIWKINNFTMTFVDDKSVSFFSLLKSGYINFKCMAMLPPPSKTNANATLHVALAGADPFEIIIATLTTDYKIKTITKSKDSHYQNITGLFLSPDHKLLITTSMDTLLMVWSLAEDRETVTDETTVTTKDGPISHAVQDKTGMYYILGHSNTFTEKKANISIWELDAKKQKLIKLAQNVPGQANQDNLTALILSTDQKYIISLSTKGEIRLWRHVDWTMVDLLASLPTGITEGIQISMTDSNRLLVQTVSEFIEYTFDFNGFILVGKSAKEFKTNPTSSYIKGNRLLSGDKDGSIRTYELTE